MLKIFNAPQKFDLVLHIDKIREVVSHEGDDLVDNKILVVLIVDNNDAAL